MPDTYEDIRRRLFDAAWETPAYAPAPARTVSRARRRAAATIVGGALAAILAVVVVAASFPLAPRDRSADIPTGADEREFLIDLSSGRVTEISETPTWDRAWWLDVSPDGRRIAFTTDVTGSPQVHVANLDGSGLRQLTRGLTDVTEPVWSPEGDRIAYIGLGENGARNVYVVDVATGRSRIVTDEPHDPWSPEWSPDGRSILFNVTIEGPEFGQEGTYLLNTPSLQLRIVDLGSRASRKVFGDENTMAYDATWTADGIVFFRGRDVGTLGAQRVDLVRLADGSERATRLAGLTRYGDWVGMAEASPDGMTIAFVRPIGGVQQVLLFDVPTGRIRVLRPGFRISWVDVDTLLIQDAPAGS